MPHHRRIQRLQARLSDYQMDAAILNLSRDLFYYTGTAQPCLLVVTPSDYRLLVKRAMDFVLRETSFESEKIEGGGTFRDAAVCIQNMGVSRGVLGLEMDVMPAALYLKLVKVFAAFSIQDVSGMIFQQRMEKDETEIAAIRKACEIMDAGHHRVMETLCPGMTEIELAAEVEYAHRRAGHEGVLSMRNFDFYISRGPLCSGDNLFKVSGFSNTITGIGMSPAVPAGPSGRKINPGDLVIVDIRLSQRPDPNLCAGRAV